MRQKNANTLEPPSAGPEMEPASVWRRGEGFLVCLHVALVVIMSASARAGAGEGPSIHWREKTFSYVAENQDLVEVLGALGAVEGLSVVVTPEVHGTVSGDFMKVSPEELLESLSAAHGLVWYCDGTGLYVYAAHEVDSLFISLEYLKPGDALRLVKKLEIYDARFPLRSVSDPPMIHVVGPPRYIENLSSVLTAAESRMSRREVRQEEVKVFALKHAWAEDVSLPLREGEVSVPGVATTLRKLMTLQNETSSMPREILPDSAVRGAGGGPIPLVKKLAGHVDSGSSSQRAAMVPDAAESGQETGAPQGQEEQYEYGTPTHMRNQLTPQIRPSIEADMRLNAVIIRDSSARMRLYEELIKQLDVPVRLVEIQASILDVNADLAFEWGLGSSLSYDDTHNSGSIKLSTPPDEVGTAISGNAGAIEASWSLLNDHLRFLTVVKALEGHGQARILSRPSLVTFANIEAELRDDRTYNVRVSGERVADLFSVTAGVQLRVTANIVDPAEEKAAPGVQLLVHIEDGNIEDTSVDGLPIVRTSALNTQAVVGHGQSLLVGGYLHETKDDNRRGVPVISRIPVVGSLFRSTSRRHEVMQRMFLLTPRIVELDAAMGLDPLESTKQLEAEKHLFDLLDKQVKGDRVNTKPLFQKDPSPKKDSREGVSRISRLFGKKAPDKKMPEKSALTENVSEEEAPVPEALDRSMPDAGAPGKAAPTRNYSFRKPERAS